MRRRMNMQSSQLERINKEIELRHNRTANLNIRNGWLRAKTIKNYQSEYDRIRSHMETNSVMPHVLRETINRRKQTLERLGARAFDGMRN